MPRLPQMDPIGAPRPALALMVAAIALLFAGCATMQLDSYVAPDIDFGKYRSYAWAPSDRLSTGDPRLDNNPFFQRRLQSDVENQLAVKGLVKRDAPDLVVHYHASVAQRVDVNGIDREFGECDAPQCEPFVYEAGTIVLDLVDARTRKLVWRGWAKESLDGVIDDQEWLEERIDLAVTRIMARLPPALTIAAP